MATVTGARTTGNVLVNQLAIDLGSDIRLLEPDVQILTTFTRETSKEAAVNPEFGWLEDEHKARFDTTTASATSGALLISVANPDFFQQWDQLLVTRTGEQLSVEAVEATSIKVARAVGSTAAAINSGDELMLIGTAQPENDTSKAARSKTPSRVTNYTQIFRNPVEMSESLEATNFVVNPSEWPRMVARAGAEHAKDKEYAFLFGRKAKATPGSTEQRRTGGALSFMTANQTDAGGDLSEAEWNAFMGTVMRYGSSDKLAMAGTVGVSALNKFPASKLMTRMDESTYGVSISQYMSPYGHVNLVYHKLMEGQKYGGYIMVVDIKQTRYRPLAGGGISRDTRFVPNIQPPDQDGKKGEFKAEAGLSFGLARMHGVVSGVTS